MPGEKSGRVPGLPRKKQRSLITIAMMVALNRTDELRLHLRASVNTGVSREELQEVLLQTANLLRRSPRPIMHFRLRKKFSRNPAPSPRLQAVHRNFCQNIAGPNVPLADTDPAENSRANRSAGTTLPVVPRCRIHNREPLQK